MLPPHPAGKPTGHERTRDNKDEWRVYPQAQTKDERSAVMQSSTRSTYTQQQQIDTSTARSKRQAMSLQERAQAIWDAKQREIKAREVTDSVKDMFGDRLKLNKNSIPTMAVSGTADNTPITAYSQQAAKGLHQGVSAQSGTNPFGRSTAFSKPMGERQD